ncbi:4-phosphoerythronate dehydrogenase [Alteromonas sp. ASW11-36]|uniref:Erythronate-4-phosphate dehydrogenase n=1 Tax=Alteromonas arenosi TaxID=3055817 RepID=A0ABT7SXR2_9ALTE|nr:4-phosphoerythronate dehydrogenase [Alteromonas sp. ASW11-36]MDM7860327.1 4-phosphoerythronate dehydrogenase [Alteromonas sp. ASW11-36]
MKILYDDNMPFAEQCFSLLGDAMPFSAGDINLEVLGSADALMVRSTTKVTAELLAQAPELQLVATATAGFDHFDLAALQAAQVPYYVSAGCNAIAVAEYVLSGIFAYAEKRQLNLADLRKLRIGVVGAGNVGSALESKLRALLFDYCLCDPPLAESSDTREFVDLDTVLGCDIICLHVPLIEDGKHPTRHLLGANQIQQLNANQLVINACRGGVIDESAFLTQAEIRKMPVLILDAWENEPAINRAMLPHCLFATPHIAGHTLEGKARGTFMSYGALCNHMGRDEEISMNQVLPSLPVVDWRSEGKCDESLIGAAIFSLYDIRQDDRIFRQAMAQSSDVGRTFTQLRKNYAQRREFAAQTIVLNEYSADDPIRQQLQGLGFDTLCTE